MPGNYNSTRWNNHERKIAVEECEKRNARICPVCSGRCKAIYRPAYHLWQQHRHNGWACRRCHNLTYAATQTWGTRANKILFEPCGQMRLIVSVLSASRREATRSAFGLRDDKRFSQLMSVAQSVETARRYTQPARRYKPRKRSHSL